MPEPVLHQLVLDARYKGEEVVPRSLYCEYFSISVNLQGQVSQAENESGRFLSLAVRTR